MYLPTSALSRKFFHNLSFHYFLYKPTIRSIKIHKTLDQIIYACFEFVLNIQNDKSLATMAKGSKQSNAREPIIAE